MLTAFSHNKILNCLSCPPPDFLNLPFLCQVKLQRHVPKSPWLERERDARATGDGRVKLTPCVMLAVNHAPPRCKPAPCACSEACHTAKATCKPFCYSTSPRQVPFDRFGSLKLRRKVVAKIVNRCHLVNRK